MKIDPTERTPQLPPQAVENAKNKKEPSGFDAVLRQTLQNTGPLKECMGSSIRSITGPQALISVPSGPENATEAMAHKMLDSLEDYQMMLGDPDVTLRRIQPAVEQMQSQADGSRELISGLPENHPLRTIIQDTISSINQEVARFNSGYYVDDRNTDA